MKVSIIIPFFNASSTIERCIKSAISQTYKNIEIVCVDNNSTDDSVKILQDYIENYQHITLYTELRKGANFARNLGVKKASGSWLNFLDADDFISKNKIENQVKALKTRYPFIASSYYYVNLNGHKRKHKIKYLNPWKDLFSGNLGITSSNLFKKKSVIDVGMWSEDYNSSQEAELMFKIIKKYGAPLMMEDEYETIIYEQKTNISNSNKGELLIVFLKLRILMIEYLFKFENKYFKSEKHWYYNELLTIVLECFPFNKFFSLKTYKTFLHKNLSIHNDTSFKRNLLVLLIKIFGFGFAASIHSKINK